MKMNKVSIELGVLERALSALGGIASESMLAKQAFCVAKALRVMEAEVKDLYETRTKLFEKYGKRDENGIPVYNESGNIEIEDENYKDFEQEILSLHATTVELELPVLELEWFENMQFSPAELLALMPLFSDAESE